MSEQDDVVPEVDQESAEHKAELMKDNAQALRDFGLITPGEEAMVNSPAMQAKGALAIALRGHVDRQMGTMSQAIRGFGDEIEDRLNTVKPLVELYVKDAVAGIIEDLAARIVQTLRTEQQAESEIDPGERIKEICEADRVAANVAAAGRVKPEKLVVPAGALRAQPVTASDFAEPDVPPS